MGMVATAVQVLAHQVEDSRDRAEVVVLLDMKL